MRTAGVVFDFYDDLSGTLLKKACPTSADLPDIVKEAHILSPEEREVLRDEAYALTMVNNGTHMRKFACVDAGNTALSILYFNESAVLLPHEAVKTAASNLMDACEEFELPVPGWLKTAAKTGMSKTRNPSKQPAPNDDVEWSQRTNLTSIQGGADSGRVIPTASQMKTAAHGGLLNTKNEKGQRIRKLPSFMYKEKTPGNVEPADVNLDGFHKLNPEAKPKEKKSAPIDVSLREADVSIKRASAQLTALGGKYPLDSMADVQKATEYFEENYKQMEPIEAHIFAVKTAARAEEIGLPLSETIQRYGSTDYAIDVDAHLANRLAVAPPEYAPVYTELREKRASIEPEEFASLLSEADEISGLRWVWGGEVADPYYATFGKQAAAWSWTGRTGDYVSEEELRWLARNGRPLVHKHFASEFTNSFIKDPITIFESMPDDSKVILARLANGKFDAMNAN